MINQKIKNYKKSDWKKTFLNAIGGCLWAFRTQKNFRIHFFLTFLVIFLCWWLKISFDRFLILILAITIGFAFEMANTTFEKTTDLITEEYSPGVKIAKDVAAGMMLIISLGLALVGLLILLPPLWYRLFG